MEPRRGQRQTNSGERGLSQAKERRRKRGKVISKWSNAPVQKTVQVEQPIDEIDAKLKQSLFPKPIVPKDLRLMKRLNECSKGILECGDNSMMIKGFNPSVVSLLTDGERIRRRVTLPQDNSCNYTGLLIGPRGQNQKKLQQQTKCKILVRGKGSQKQDQAGGVEQQGQLHVLILGSNEMNVARACTQVERIIFSNESARNKLRDDQMKLHRQLKAQNQIEGQDLAMNTPYGTASTDAFIIQVPNQCVGLVIGKDGLTIKMIKEKSGARDVQVATSSPQGIDTRNVFVEGEKDAIQRARKMIEGIVQRLGVTEQIKSHITMQMQVPSRLIGLVIGKAGETIKAINSKTGAYVYLSKEEAINKNRKILKISGPQNLCYSARYQIDIIIQNGLKNLKKTEGKLTEDEMAAIRPVQTYPQQFNGITFVSDDSDPDYQCEFMMQQLSMMNPTMTQILFKEINPSCQIKQEIVYSKRRTL